MQKKSLESQYSPAEDTFFIADYLKNEKGKNALDIGTGSGYLANVLSSNFSTIVATDIDFFSLQNQNFYLENRVCCKSAEVFHEKFDLIVCNLPYLPSNKILDRTTDGGKEGIEIPIQILKSGARCVAKNGKIIFLTTSLANYEKLIDYMKNLKFETKIVSRKKLFYEELILIEAKLL